MRRPALAFILFLLSALPAFAQSSEFGLLYGGNMRYTSRNDKGADNSFSFNNTVKEVYYAVETDPGTWFGIKVGQLQGVGVLRYDTGNKDTNGNSIFLNAQDPSAKVEHLDGVVNYRFSEPFGSTGLFAGVGYYRTRANYNSIDIPANVRGAHSETSFGFQVGVHGDFPLSRRYGIITEGTYQWVNTAVKARYLVVTGGLRISF